MFANPFGNPANAAEEAGVTTSMCRILRLHPESPATAEGGAQEAAGTRATRNFREVIKSRSAVRGVVNMDVKRKAAVGAAVVEKAAQPI